MLLDIRTPDDLNDAWVTYWTYKRERDRWSKLSPEYHAINGLSPEMVRWWQENFAIACQRIIEDINAYESRHNMPLSHNR